MLATLAAQPAAGEAIVPDPASPFYRLAAGSGAGNLSVLSAGRVTGDVHANGSVVVFPFAAVEGDASATGTIGGGGQISGGMSSGAPPLPFPTLGGAALRAAADRILQGPQVLTNARIDDVLYVDGSVLVVGTIDGNGTLVAAGGLYLLDCLVACPLASDTHLSVISLGDLYAGFGRRLRGLLLAGRDLALGYGVEGDGVAAAGRNVIVSAGVQWRYLAPDTTPPTITEMSPGDGALITDSRPPISALFEDEVAGIDAESVELLVDFVERTAEADVSESSIIWTSAEPMIDGLHVVQLAVSDRAGNAATAEWTFSIDTTPPSISIGPFENPELTEDPLLPVRASLFDWPAGIDAATFRISVDGIPFESSCTVLADRANCTTPELATGLHTIAASLRDLAGLEGTATTSIDLVVDLEPPVATILAPEDGSTHGSSPIQVIGRVTDDGVVERVRLNRAPVTLVDDSFVAEVQLQEGSNTISLFAQDLAGRSTSATARVRLDTEDPVLLIDRPDNGALSNSPSIRVVGQVVDAGVDVVRVAGVVTPVEQGRYFEAEVPLSEGENTIVVSALDLAGNAGEAAVSVTYLPIPAVSISSPPDLAWIAATTTDVSGTVAEGATVEVNGVPAVVSGSTYFASDVPLIEGGNILTATARTLTGAAGTDHVQVVRDSTAPRLEVDRPRDGEIVNEPAVAVAGLVNDLVVGTVSASEVEVVINGQPAQVENRRFLLPELALAPGENTIVVQAQDESGNEATATVRVRYEERAGPKVAIVSGNLQTGFIGTLLAQPLRVRVLDGAGLPVAGQPVLFRVEGGDGTVGDGRRSFVVATDGSGEAATTFRLGSYAGAGAQVVRAVAAGYGEVEARATALPGEPELIVADSGSQQLGLAGHSVPRPLVAAIVDSGGNRLAQVPVRFEVVKGGGHFEDGATEHVVLTDSDGRAITSFVLGPEEGTANNVVVTRIEGWPEGPSAAFVATGWAAGEPAETAIRGVVLDNQNDPVPGVTVRIKDHPQTALTDEQGRFRIANAPVGTMYLIADGSTTTRPGAWPDLEFVVTTVPGRENDLGMPILLLPIDLGSGVFVSETEGGVVTLPAVPGFALEIAPGSVTFPGGSRTGVVSVTAVHSDRVPMVPSFGQQPRLIVTIQPAGARFDPPARMTAPNLEGLPPGMVTELYSFDHDLGHFVSIGPATVSIDGTVVASNQGVGILKAGWHAPGRPGPSGGACNCGPCLSCIEGACVAACPTPGAGVQPLRGEATRAQCPGPCEDGVGCTTNDTCDGRGNCKGAPVFLEIVSATADGEQEVRRTVRDNVQFVAEVDSNCPTVDYSWDFGDESTSQEQNPTHRFAKVGRFDVQLRASCRECESASDSEEVHVDATTPEIMVAAWIDGSLIELESGARAELRAAFASPLTCAPMLGAWAAGRRVMIESDIDRRYANSFLLKHSANASPPTPIEPLTYRESENFRGFARVQALYESVEGMVVGDVLLFSPVILELGPTPDPCTGIGFPRYAPEIHPLNGRVGVTSSGDGVYALVQGRLGSLGQAGDRTLNACDQPNCSAIPIGPTTPWIWAELVFDPAGEPTVESQIFPTYWILDDGRVSARPQSDDEAFVALDASNSERTLP